MKFLAFQYSALSLLFHSFMLKKLFVLWALLTVLFDAKAQTMQEFAKTPQGLSLMAPCISYRDYCASLSFSADKKQVLLLQRTAGKDGKIGDKGLMSLYQQGDTVPLWTVPCKVQTTFPVGSSLLTLPQRFQTRITPYGILMPTGSKYTMLAMDGTNKKWEQKLYPVAVFDSLDVILGYTSAMSNKLVGIRLSTGEKLWEAKSSHSLCNGWERMTMAGDSLIVVVNDRIDFVHPLKGLQGQFNVHTGLPRTGQNLLTAVAAGLAFGAVGATVGYNPYLVSSVDINSITTTSSSALYDNRRCFVSDRDSIYCLSTAGKAVWSRALPKRETGNAALKVQGDTLIMLNYAFGFQGDRQMKAVGRPFVAAFNKSTGEQLYLRYLTEDTRAIVEGAHIGTSSAFLMLSDHMAYKPFADSTMTVRPWNTRSYGELEWLPSDTVYTFRQNDENLTPLFSNDSICVVQTAKGLLKVVDRQLNIIDDYQASNLYFKFIPCGSCLVVYNKIVGKASDFWIIRRDGTSVAHIMVPVNKMYSRGNILYILSSDKIFTVDTTHL